MTRYPWGSSGHDRMHIDPDVSTDALLVGSGPFRVSARRPPRGGTRVSPRDPFGPASAILSCRVREGGPRAPGLSDGSRRIVKPLRAPWLSSSPTGYCRQCPADAAVRAGQVRTFPAPCKGCSYEGANRGWISINVPVEVQLDVVRD
jgi:hypothetical protein